MHRPFFSIEDGDLRPFLERARQNYEKWKAATQSNGIFDWQNRLVVSLGLAGAPFYGNKTWRRFRNRPISRSLFETIVDDMQAPALEFYRMCIDRGLLLAAIEAPPPQRGHRAVEALGAERVFQLSEAFTRPVRQFLGEHGVPVLSVPAADDEGFLRGPLVGDNDSHANAEWGASMARLILQCAACAQPSERPTGAAAG
jgi:hypothetical protein